VRQIGEEIETLFQPEGKGYNWHYENHSQVHIAGTHVYHLTRKENLDLILKDGLLPKECQCGFLDTNRIGIYVSTSMYGCLKWQHHVTGHRLIAEPAIIKFTVSSEDQVFPDLRVDFKDDFVLTNTVSPDRLTVFS
jgi:hypothetical protein